MDAGVVSNFRPKAFASRTAAENFQMWEPIPGWLPLETLAAGRSATAVAGSLAGITKGVPPRRWADRRGSGGY